MQCQKVKLPLTNSNFEFASSKQAETEVLQLLQKLGIDNIGHTKICSLDQKNLASIIMLVLNMAISRVVGIFVALFLAFLPAFASVSDSPKLYYVIPTTWANITMFDVKGTSLYPTLLYAVIGILVINLALRFTAVHLIKNRQVEIISH